MPRVTNADLILAYARLHRVGLRVSFPQSFSASSLGCPPVIGRQSPHAGLRVRKGTVVTLQAQLPRCGGASPSVPSGRLPSAKVPNFIGQPVSTAVAWADSHRLYWAAEQLPPLVVGDASHLLDNYRVTHQQPAARAPFANGASFSGSGESHQATGRSRRSKGRVMPWSELLDEADRRHGDRGTPQILYHHWQLFWLAEQRIKEADAGLHSTSDVSRILMAEVSRRRPRSA